MNEPTNLMQRQAAALFPDSEEEQSVFLNALLNPTETRHPAVIRTRPEADVAGAFPVLTGSDVPSWLPEELYFLPAGETPGKSALFASGSIYPMDISSVYTASAMLAASSPKRILDVCAAPGGKSLFASTVLQPDYLLSNEVVGKRLGILRHNLKKTGRPNLYTQSLDPAELAETGKCVFDLVIVDAPCSGQSLLARGTENQGCFHPNIIKGNAKRQLRIISQSSECVVPGGYLFYSTCTFARRENEGILEKFLKRHPEFAPVDVPHLSECRSTQSDLPCYRIYPHRDRGAGGFAALLQRQGEGGETAEIPDVFLEYPVEPAS